MSGPIGPGSLIAPFGRKPVLILSFSIVGHYTVFEKLQNYELIKNQKVPEKNNLTIWLFSKKGDKLLKMSFDTFFDQMPFDHSTQLRLLTIQVIMDGWRTRLLKMMME